MDKIDKLAHQFAALDVVDQLRRSHRMSLPDAELILEFEGLACDIMKRPRAGSEKIRKRRIVASFGAPVLVIAKVWELLMETGGPWPIATEKKHLLWTLHMAKVYATTEILASNVGARDEKTFRKWVKTFLFKISDLTPDVVSG
jgi:hypothetical protein